IIKRTTPSLRATPPSEGNYYSSIFQPYIRKTILRFMFQTVFFSRKERNVRKEKWVLTAEGNLTYFLLQIRYCLSHYPFLMRM
ncbi:MAG TPA: hypothetical protein PKJ08_11130, partial [Candidatus Cloacimonadota bacterium]|nr:hypothetical protein [Candidatus Cloacimonadota bacterium]